MDVNDDDLKLGAGSIRSDNKRVRIVADDGGHRGGSLPSDPVSAEAASAASARTSHHAARVGPGRRRRSSLRHLQRSGPHLHLQVALQSAMFKFKIFISFQIKI